MEDSKRNYEKLWFELEIDQERFDEEIGEFENLDLETMDVE